MDSSVPQSRDPFRGWGGANHLFVQTEIGPPPLTVNLICSRSIGSDPPRTAKRSFPPNSLQRIPIFLRRGFGDRRQARVSLAVNAEGVEACSPGSPRRGVTRAPNQKRPRSDASSQAGVSAGWSPALVVSQVR